MPTLQRADRTQGIASTTVRIAGWLTIAIGVLHLVVGVATANRWNLELLWFEGSGIAVILIGTLSLLVHRRADDRVLRRVVITANAFGVALGLAFCLMTGWREPQGIALIILFGVAAAASLSIGGLGTDM